MELENKKKTFIKYGLSSQFFLFRKNKQFMEFKKSVSYFNGKFLSLNVDEHFINQKFQKKLNTL